MVNLFIVHIYCILIHNVHMSCRYISGHYYSRHSTMSFMHLFFSTTASLGESGEGEGMSFQLATLEENSVIHLWVRIN